MVPGHATSIREPITSALRKGKLYKVSTSSSPSMVASNVKILEPSTVVKKPHSMTSMYLDPINVERNVDAFAKYPIALNVMENVETSKNTNKPRSVTTLTKSSMIFVDRDDIDKNIRMLISQVLGIEPETEDKEDFDGMSSDLADKEENFVEKKDQSTYIVNIYDMDSDDEPISKRLAPGITKRLKNRKGWRKVVTPISKKKPPKRKEVLYGSSESDHDVEHNVQDIIPATRKQASGKKIPANIPEVPINNISFHYVDNVEKWKFVYQIRLELERELGKDAFECKKVTSLIEEVRLMKSVTGFGRCFKMLVKEFIMNISKECDNKSSKKFRKMYVRGRCVDFSSEIINMFLGRNEEEQAEVEVFNNVICKEITAKQVKEWETKGKLSASYLTVKYVVLHRIGVTNWVSTNHTYTIAIKLDILMTSDQKPFRSTTRAGILVG
ncbi:uncharacterized protein LOC127079579 [Lathyrus oleraceus]|uniref:uncharacterized protein LOC127079579 n=1 Tax=Pisum sativum TaxID=3888 RepID=UPI0021D33881|nr:uncharacterized protein LOC127079579 [Pisum sativum]